jgi:hypothetical protein
MLYLARSWGVQAQDLDTSFDQAVEEFDKVLVELKEIKH